MFRSMVCLVSVKISIRTKKVLIFIQHIQSFKNHQDSRHEMLSNALVTTNQKLR